MNFAEDVCKRVEDLLYDAGVNVSGDDYDALMRALSGARINPVGTHRLGREWCVATLNKQDILAEGFAVKEGEMNELAVAMLDSLSESNYWDSLRDSALKLGLQRTR